MSGYKLLCALEDDAAALVVFDPQYRGVMDAMEYGNEGARQKKRAQLPQQSDNMIRLFVAQIARVLRPGGYLLLWTDKYALGEASHLRYLAGTELKVVDLICWDTLGFGMGKRTRGRAQYAVIVQRPPTTARYWLDRRIVDVWPEGADRQRHPHAKPYQLTERLIRAMTKRGDLVVDPCAGGYGVLDACLRSRREFIGCDLATEAP